MDSIRFKFTHFRRTRKKVEISNIYGSSKNMANAFITLLVEGIEMKRHTVSYTSHKLNKSPSFLSVGTNMTAAFVLAYTTQKCGIAIIQSIRYVYVVHIYIYMNVCDAYVPVCVCMK